MRYLFLCVGLVLTLTQPAYADYIPVTLDPITHRTASLTIITDDGTPVVYTPAQLEEFPTYSLTTTTPWRSEPATFEGVMLADILAANGLTNADKLLVTAENDYATDLSRDLLQSVPILVATRVNGRAHTPRERGPIQFVIDADDYANSSLTTESAFVWMAAQIEVSD